MLGEDDLGRAGGSSSSSRSARGNSQDSDPDWGVIPRSVHALFQELNSRSASAAALNLQSRGKRRQGSGDGDEQDGSDYEDDDDEGDAGSFHYSVHCSMLQIYNEQLHDLLSPAALNGEGDALHIRETPGNNANGGDGKGTQGELFVSGLSSYRVEAVEDVLALLRFGAQARAVRATEYNEVTRSQICMLSQRSCEPIYGNKKNHHDGHGIRRATLSPPAPCSPRRTNITATNLSM